MGFKFNSLNLFILTLFVIAHTIPTYALNLASRDCLSTYRLLVDNQTPSLELFRTLFATAKIKPLSQSQKADNQKYIDLLEGPQVEKIVFLHGMLKPLKRLNEVTFAGDEGSGKEDVNAMRNIFRILFIENLEANPKLAECVMGRFFDFKTMELALNPEKFGTEKRMIAAVNEVLTASHIQFENVLFALGRENPRIIKNVLNERGIAGDFRAWHLFGIAKGNPDLAVTAARLAAADFSREHSTKLAAKEFNEADANRILSEIENEIKPRLLETLGADSPVFEQYVGSKHRVLSHDAIDILRKVNASDNNEYFSTVRIAFLMRTGVVLNREQVFLLRDYFSLSDYFQPTIRVAEPSQIDISQANFGVMNIDFAAQNVENLYHTMGALSEAQAQGQKGNPSPATLAISLSRLGEKLATERLERLKFTATEAARLAGLEGKFQFSGDDGSFVFTKPPTAEQRTAFYSLLNKAKDSLSNYRIVWVPPMKNKHNEIDTGAMSRESLKAEDFEKKLRQKLYGIISRPDLKTFAIVSEILPETKKIEVTLYGVTIPKQAQVIYQIIDQFKLMPKGYTLQRSKFEH